MLKKLIKLGRFKLSGLDIHTKEVIRKSSASTIVRVAGKIIGLLVSVFLGRTIGAEGLGIINLSNRIVSILLIIGLLGMRQVIIKEVAIAHNKKNFAHIGNVMHTAYWLNGSITLALTIIFILLSPWLANHVFKEPRLTYPLILFLIVMTPQVFSRVFSSALIGYRKIWQSNLVEQTLSISITGIILIVFFLLKWHITVNLVAVCYAIGRIGVTISVGLYWNSLYHFKRKRITITKPLLKTSIPLFVASITGIIMANADAVILGAYGNSTDVGLYTVAAQIALLTSFFLQVTSSSVSPKIAALYERGQIKELEKMVQQVTKGLGIIGTGTFFLFLLLGRNILNIWGEEFMDAYSVLLILGIGQLVNIATGAVGSLLAMTGQEKKLQKINFIFALFNVMIGILFVYFFQIIGIAIAIALTIILSNIVKLIFVRKTLNIQVIPILKI